MGVDINNQSVAKNSTNLFIFNPKPFYQQVVLLLHLVVSYDYIQGGLELDPARIIKRQCNYDVLFDESTRKLEFVAKASETALANADRTKEFDLTSIKVYFLLLMIQPLMKILTVLTLMVG